MLAQALFGDCHFLFVFLPVDSCKETIVLNMAKRKCAQGQVSLLILPF